jgi:ABC-type nitrate/sulfonate/bicarbonate transport system permease component
MMLRLLSLAVFLFVWWAASLMAGEQMLPAPATVLGAIDVGARSAVL